MTCRHAQEEIAVALLERRAPDDDVATHVDTCPACAAERAGLRQVAALLPAVTLADVTAGRDTMTSDPHLQRILRAATGERTQAARRRRTVRIVSAAAALIVVIGGVAAGAAIWSRDRVITASASQGEVAATADIARTDDGSELQVVITGVPRGTDCVLTVHAADGRQEPVLEWVAKYDDVAHVVAQTSLPPDAIASVTLTRGDGELLLAIPVNA